MRGGAGGPRVARTTRPLDLVAVSSWAERNNVVYASYQELAGHPRVYDLLKQHVEEVNRSLADEKVMKALRG